ncbi:MAG: hypothetical protein I3273_02145 [Candidatus Moeniiplasma glomeromycotorum]|nr:hypothetical protein [Candidatus Moeniiplasma glomeromycotorum]MCE8167079.1 hypothetical protein [Candidatus Moeniiplasma glomeromycotorum]MCE8168909.1 hypothetical protein [Candidatus Moeniiplasma glomeromycotorum]
MTKENLKILKSGSVYFFYRPKIEKRAEVQRFFLVLHSLPPDLYHLLIVGKKHLPAEKEGSYFAFLETIKKDKNDLLRSFGEKSYSTATRGERVLPTARCLGVGKFLLVEHQNHTHLIYRLTAPQNIKSTQTEFNLQKEGDYLISVKNPQVSTSSGVGLGNQRRAVYPDWLQTKMANYRFIPLNPSDFLNYEGTELLLIAKARASLIQREPELVNCWEEVGPQ